MSLLIHQPSGSRDRFDPNDGIEIREATADDNQALLDLARVTHFVTNVTLRTDRDPDFFALGWARGETTYFVATYMGQVIGCISMTTQSVYINGLLERVAHGNDLMVHPSFTGRHLSLRLGAAGEDYLRACGIDISFVLVAEGNSTIRSLARGKHGQPIFHSLGRFLVDQLVPLPIRGSSKKHRAEEPTRDDIPALVAMLSDDHRCKNFAPPITHKDVETQFNDLKRSLYQKILVVREAGRIVATLTIHDTRHLRRTVMVDLPWQQRLLLCLLRAVPFLRVPRVGVPLNVLYVRFMACSPGHEAALKALLVEARYAAFQGGYSALWVGLHERDPLRLVTKNFPKATCVWLAMASCLEKPERVDTLVDKVFYEDFALV